MGTRSIVCVLAGVTLLMTACMRTVNIGDPALKPYASMYSVDRAQYGFTPLPEFGSVSIEGKSLQGDYDAMIHFDGNPSRTVAFRMKDKAYQWLNEQEIFEGSWMYETPDGRFHETVSITFLQR